MVEHKSAECQIRSGGDIKLEDNDTEVVKQTHAMVVYVLIVRCVSALVVCVCWRLFAKGCKAFVWFTGSPQRSLKNIGNAKSNSKCAFTLTMCNSHTRRARKT